MVHGAGRLSRSSNQAEFREACLPGAQNLKREERQDVAVRATWS